MSYASLEGEVYPVYYVIAERPGGNGAFNQYGLPLHIVRVIECDISELQACYDAYVAPLQRAGIFTDIRIYSREPETFLRSHGKYSEDATGNRPED